MENVIYAVVAALIGLGVLIVIHELGHFLVAKKSGVGVITYSIGFGPKLWKKKIGETEYAVSAFPLGGYVKMVGEDPGEEVEAVDVAKSFSHQPLGKRALIVAAGPGFNLLLAVFLFAWIFTFFGVPVLTTKVGSVEPDSPAAQAGLTKGDEIVAIDGHKVSKWEDLSERIRGSAGKTLTLRIRRGQTEVEAAITPKQREGRNIFGEKTDIWAIGIASELEVQKSPPWQALGQAVYKTGEYSVLTLAALGKMITGDVSPRNLGGPLMIAQMAGQQAREGIENYLFFLALLSVNLGVLNLLPIPVLDGGHLLFFLIEWMIGRPVEMKHRERAQQVGFFVLILVMIYAFYNDVSRFFEG
jgi:regulator of sigma E protease